MKTILLFDPRFPLNNPHRLTVADDLASAAVRAGVAAATNPSEAGALAAGTPLSQADMTEVVMQHGVTNTALARVFVPLSVAQVGASLGILAAVGRPIGGFTPTPTPTPSPTLNGVVPTYGLISATADGSTGQTYTLNASWTNVQWYRMRLATPVSFTAIPGATSATYVAQVADEGYRLAVAGVEGGANRAAKAYHVVLAPPVILEDFENLADWTAANGADIQLATDTPAYGTKRLQVTSTGTSGATATKADIGSFDTSLLGTIAILGDAGMDAGRQTGDLSVVLKRFGAAQGGPSFGTMYETPSPLLMGRLWGCMHVSDNAALNSPGGGTVGLAVGPTGDIPHSKVSKFDALLGKAGGRATVCIGFDDLKVTQYTFAYPLMKSLGLVGGMNLVGTTSSNPAAVNIPKLQEMYTDGWDINLDSTFNDNITSSFGTLAAAGASLQQLKDLAAANNLTRGNEHGCWTGGQIETNPPSARVFVASVTSTGTAVVTMASTSGITQGMRAIGHNVPNSPNTTVVSVDSSTQVTLSANVPAQSKPMKFEDTSPEFYTMKLPVYYRDVMGMKLMRTTRAQGGMHTRFGFGDRTMFVFGNALHALTLDQFKAVLDRAELLGLTVIFYTHGIIPGGGGVESDTQVFTDQMNELASRQNAGRLDVMTPSQIWARDGGASVPTGLQRPPTVVAAGVSFVSASAANDTPAAPTGHQSGDVLMAFAYRDGGTGVPTLPSGWTALSSGGANNSAYLLAYKVATSSAETIGTFTGATNTVVQCYRGANASTPIGNVSPAATGSSGSSSIPASSWTLQSPGTSWVAYFGGSRSASSDMDTTANRIGHTNATSGSDAGGNDTYGPVTTLSNLSAGSSGGTFWYAIAVEIKS